MKASMSRRSALRKIGGSGAALATLASLTAPLEGAETSPGPKLKGRIHQSVCQWCYKQIPLEELCIAAKGMGLQSIDLVEVKDLPTLKKHGLICAMVTGVPGMIANGLNRSENH